jgi:hypothetical protein
MKSIMEDLIEMGQETTDEPQEARQIFKKCKHVMQTEDQVSPSPKLMFVALLHLAAEKNGNLAFKK